MASENRERVQQKMRTRRDLVAAAKTLLLGGEVPTIPSVAREASVSRGTVYRFFPSQQALLAEVLVAVTVSVEHLRKLFEQSPDPSNPEQRLRIVCTAVYRTLSKEEPAFRAFLRYSLEDGEASASDRRVKGRFFWIDAALEPIGDKLSPERLALLRIQLATLLGIEPFIVYRDICRLSSSAAAGAATKTAITLLRCALEDRPKATALK